MKIEKNMIIDGYRILEDLPIGEGGWGRVWLAESLSGNIHEKVAIKMLSLNDLMNKCIEEHRNFGSGEDVKCIFSEKIDAFKNEYKNVRKLNHPNIARAYGFGSFDNHLYIASEYVDGTSITSATHNMPIDDIIAYLLQGLLGLEAIHKHGLLHLDIKGENILLTKDGRIKIIDFGLSAAIENLKIRLCGSLPYMAPEVIFQDKSHIGAQSDLYSYGSLMYRCLTGRYPSLQRELMDFDYEKLQKLVREEKFRLPSELRSDIPKYMDKIIMRLISNDYNKRYYGENIRAVINALATHRPDDFRETIEVKGSYLIPKNNEHIGREKEQKFIFNILKQFIGGKQPSPSVIAISGEAGMGKTHLLSKIRDFLGQHSEGFVTCSLDLPAHDDWLTAWNKKTSLAISENAKPVVVIIDNVDKNESSVTIPNNLVQLLNDRLKDPGLFHDTSPLILIFTGLPENINIILQNSGPERSIYYHIQLEPFTKNQVKKYLSLTTALKNHKIPDNWIKKIYEATAGVPLELAERLQIQDSRGLLFGLDGTLHLSTLLEKNEVQRIPESTKSRLTKHCKALCEAEKNIIDLMAVWFKNNFFNSISFDDIYNFYPQSYIRQILDGLIQKRILKHVGILSSYTFYDNFHMSEFFYNNIDENLRNNLHLRISNRLQGIDADGDILHGAYGEHTLGSWVPLLRLARKRLFGDGDIGFAKNILCDFKSSFAPLNSNLDIVTDIYLTDVFSLDGDFGKAESYYKSALTTIGRRNIKTPGLSALAHLSIIPSYLERGVVDRAEDIISMINKILRGRKKSLFNILALNYLPRCLHIRSQREPDNLKKYLSEAEKIYLEGVKAENNLRVESRNLIKNNELGLMQYLQGKYAESISSFQKNIKKLERVPNIFALIENLYNLANAYRMAGKYDEAIGCAERLLKLVKKTATPKRLYSAYILLASIHFDRGDYKAALENYNISFNASTLINDPHMRHEATSWVLVNIGHCLKELGEYKSAIIHFEAEINRKPPPLCLASAYMGYGEICIKKRHLKRGEEYFKEAELILGKLPNDAAKPYRVEINKIRANV